MFSLYGRSPHFAETINPVYALPEEQGIESRDLDNFPQ
jgi:hypothetical protein